MLADCFRYGRSTAKLGIHPGSYREMRASGRYVVRADLDNNPLEYTHPMGTLLLYPDQAMAEIQFEATNATYFRPDDVINIADTNEHVPRVTINANTGRDQEIYLTDARIEWGTPNTNFIVATDVAT